MAADIWAVGDKIGAVSQGNDPRVLTGPGTVVETHDDGIAVQWPGERHPNRYWYASSGMIVERMA